MKKLFLYLCLYQLSACDIREPELTEAQRWAERAQAVTIIRDDFGVPHIFGKTDADTVFGLMYAQAEDDFNRVERNYIWAIGRLAEVEGEDSLYSDLRARLYMTEAQARQHYDNSPPWLQALCDAFADGLNYYLHTHPEVKPKLLTRFEPWMPMYFTEGSIGGDIERVPTDGIRRFYQQQALLSATNQGVDSTSMEEPAGSNGIAIAPRQSATGHALLLINPHTSFFFRAEVHMVSEEGLNAYGAVTWGQFFVYQGFNQNAGWMHTSTGVDIIDEFLETVERREGRLMYRYGDQWRDVQTSQIELRYADGDDQAIRRFTAYHTHHGPITHSINDKWVATSIMWNPVQALTQSYLRTKTTGLASFQQVMDLYTNSSNNTVYADSGGNIAYWHGNFIPKRDPNFDYSQPVDGSNPATDWQGSHSQDESIVIINPANGWIQNANSTPFTAAGPNSPKRQDYPPYMAPDAENYRGVQAVRLLQQAEPLTLDSLIELAYDPYLLAFESIVPALLKSYRQQPARSEALAEAIAQLQQWDLRVSVDSVAMSLAHYYGTLLSSQPAPRHLRGVDRTEYLVRETPAERQVALLSQAIERLTRDFGTWRTPWGEINRYQRLNGDIQLSFDDQAPSKAVPMASARWGALAAYGARGPQKTKRLYGTRGNSFVAVVEFGPRVVAKSLLAGGQSGDPQSPHFDDQVQRYIDADFKEVAFYREDIERRASKTYHPGGG